MTDKKIYFLSGLPRTGSTLLGSILSQNPEIHVTPTSPMYPLLVSTNEQFNLLSLQYTYDHNETSRRVYHAMIKAFYANIEDPIIFDKHRGWPKHIPAIEEYLNPEARIIATVRPIVEIITSYLVLADKDPTNFIDRDLREQGKLITNENRAVLLWEKYIMSTYLPLKEGLENNPDNILLVQYRDIVSSPETTLQKVYEFCGIATFDHTWTDIENKCAEAKDEAWGLKNLHTIRPVLGMKSASPSLYLPQEAIGYFSQFDIPAYGQ